MPQAETISAIDYADLRAYLDDPGARTLTWDAHRELLHAHDADEDADWPAPTTWNEVRDLTWLLPHRAQVLCAFVAAEIPLPLWEQWARSGVNGVVRVAPRRVLELVRRWLDRDGVGDQQLRDVARVPAYADSYIADAASHAASHAAIAIVADTTRASSAAVANAAACAAVAHTDAAYTGGAHHRFYAHWWRRCRARLALAAIGTAELE